MELADLGLIGNCQISALVHRSGAIVWSCMPRFDSPPVFAALLDEDGGSFVVSPADRSLGTQSYLGNTNVLETRFTTPDGQFRVLDFAPRFLQHERVFRPTKLIRIIEPLAGTPRIRVHCRPVLGWTKKQPHSDLGSHHLAWQGYPAQVRLTTDAALAHLDGEPFALTQRRHFVFSWGAPVEEPLEPLCERFLQQTVRHWRQWVKQCDIPPIYQDEVIRSALALKLHCYEDTGAIVAALTTSIPEAPGTTRTWDYRYCWLRDSFYALGAFRLLGQFAELEQFLNYLLDVASSTKQLDLAPLYQIDGKAGPAEQILDDWRGYGGQGPVRIGNQAASHRQNDVFGEMVIALAPFFLDARFREQVTEPVLDLVTRLARKAVLVAGQPDAGIWEYRENWRPQTFSAVMCWAAADRMAGIADRYAPADSAEFRAAAERIRAEVMAQSWSANRKSFIGHYGGDDLDASLLQMVRLRFLPPGDPRLRGTLDAIHKDLSRGGWLQRYSLDDGFGKPSVAFVICTFWLIEALATAGRRDEARAVFDQIHVALSPLGLLSEDYDPTQRRMWGNFPQTYSHVGLIHAAFAASPSWTEVL